VSDRGLKPARREAVVVGGCGLEPGELDAQTVVRRRVDVAAAARDDVLEVRVLGDFVADALRRRGGRQARPEDAYVGGRLAGRDTVRERAVVLGAAREGKRPQRPDRRSEAEKIPTIHRRTLPRAAPPSP